MKLVAYLSIALLVAISSAAAQSSRRPDQFYTNGQAMNAWTAMPSQKAQSTFWFVRHPTNSAAYRQMLAIIYDDQPDHVFYLDTATRLIVGRLDLTDDRFSLLPAAARASNIEDIADSAYPRAGQLPRASELFANVDEGQPANNNRLLLPPPTKKYPRLAESAWDTCYMSADRFQIRSTLKLNRNQGTYRLRDKPGTGRLSNIRYGRDKENHTIEGDWVLGQSKGWFKLTIPEENLNLFWGHFGFQSGRIVGAWDGVRTTARALKEVENPVR